jgi:two-component system, NarL family, invasion response regulator UvrY
METILIADDHEIVRRGVRMIIEGFPQKYNFIEANTCASVMQILSVQKVDYAIMDMMLADGNVFSTTQQLAAYSDRVKILVYSMNSEKIYAKRFLQKGVRGFVCKQSSIEELQNGIRSLLKGEIYISPELKEILFNTNKKDILANPIDALSDRELEVVEYVATGMGAKEIAKRMHLDITTISTYRRRAFEKLAEYSKEMVPDPEYAMHARRYNHFCFPVAGYPPRSQFAASSSQIGRILLAFPALFSAGKLQQICDQTEISLLQNRPLPWYALLCQASRIPYFCVPFGELSQLAIASR